MSGVEITIKDIYDLLMSLKGQVQASMGTLDQTKITVTDHETRIRALERWSRGMPVALVVSLASIIIAAVAVFAH